MQELALPALFVFLPQRKGACGEFGVRLAGAICATHDAGFTSRRRARVARTPGVKQGDAGPAFEEMKSGPATEGAGSDDCNVWFSFHRESFCRLRVEDTGDGPAGEVAAGGSGQGV